MVAGHGFEVGPSSSEAEEDWLKKLKTMGFHPCWVESAVLVHLLALVIGSDFESLVLSYSSQSHAGGGFAVRCVISFGIKCCD